METEAGGAIDLSDQAHFRFRPNAAEGTARVIYRPTRLHKTAFCLSALTLAGVLALALFRRRRPSAQE